MLKLVYYSSYLYQFNLVSDFYLFFTIFRDITRIVAAISHSRMEVGSDFYGCYNRFSNDNEEA